MLKEIEKNIYFKEPILVKLAIEIKTKLEKLIEEYSPNTKRCEKCGTAIGHNCSSEKVCMYCYFK